ncbi:MAG TPA: transposase [Gammaproteobacteria bacterium]|nr:transposase [Gammaproteobacteria bacterium]
MTQKKKWSAAKKFEIALLAIKGETTLNEICKHYQVAPSQIHAWKKELLSRGAELFGKEGKTKKTNLNHEDAQRKLYEKIGQLTVERDFLKKGWERFQGNKDED